MSNTSEAPWRDAGTLMPLYEERTCAELAERFGCSPGTISTWATKHRADDIRESIDVEIPDEEPYKDRDVMKSLYVKEQLSTTEISAVLECSTGAVNNWLEEHGIESRSASEGLKIAFGGSHGIWFRTNPRKGYERVACEKKTVLHHRLLAVAYWGMDAVRGNHVHHENHIPWDNRKENLKLVDPSNHSKMHRERKMTWLDALRATEMYDEGASSYDLAPMFDVTPSTILANVRRVDPDIVRSSGGAS